MQALNHTVFGTLIAVTINEPALALPLAFGSHFLLDSIPHYGKDPRTDMGTKVFPIRLLIDGLASALILLLFISLDHSHVWLILGCVALALAPDFSWLLIPESKQKGRLKWFFKFHKIIQHESKKGIFVELGWFAVTTALVFNKIL
jgi:hypothetical protein